MPKSPSPNALESYQKAGLLGKGGYLPDSHSFLQEYTILLLDELLKIFRSVFLQKGWSGEELRGKKVLEVGSAWGFRLEQLTGFNLDPRKLYGIDLVPRYISWAKANHPLIRYKKMSATKMSFPKDSFDFSYGVMVLSAMPDDDTRTKSLREMCRVSRDFVLIVDNFVPSHRETKKGVDYLRGISADLLEQMSGWKEVSSVVQVGSFWTVAGWAWKFKALLGRLGFESLSYALAIRYLAPHSHRAYFVKLKK